MTGGDARLPLAINVLDGETIYMCTADDEVNMVSLIQNNFCRREQSPSLPANFPLKR